LTKCRHDRSCQMCLSMVASRLMDDNDRLRQQLEEMHNKNQNEWSDVIMVLSKWNVALYPPLYQFLHQFWTQTTQQVTGWRAQLKYNMSIIGIIFLLIPW
jgi:hypothetical protein